MFPLGRRHAVGGPGGPVIYRIDDEVDDAEVDHGLDGKGHPRCKRDLEAVTAMGHMRRLMIQEPDAMADELGDDAAPRTFCYIADCLPDL